jgi:hypothetical protein
MTVLRTVRVVPNQTLYQTSIEQLGNYANATLRKIGELKPVAEQSWLHPVRPREIRRPRLAEVPGNAFSTKKRSRMLWR